MGNKLQILKPKEHDLGGFFVRRVLPQVARRMVGPFVFFDHMGPADFPPGKGINVRPHPHIHLATVTYLFDGKIHHRDSLGSDQHIEPGAINWMTAGRGIVHSERASDDKGGRLNGIQLWVALPEKHENTEPSFTHIPANKIPMWTDGAASIRLLLGAFGGKCSPAPVHSDLFYLEVKLAAGAHWTMPAEQRECAVYLAGGSVSVDGEKLSLYEMGVLSPEPAEIRAREESRLMILGGTSLGPRFMNWNFVSSSKENLSQACQDWKNGPGPAGSRFPKVPGDESEFIPLPIEALR